jgi:hypothetical protein
MGMRTTGGNCCDSFDLAGGNINREQWRIAVIVGRNDHAFTADGPGFQLRPPVPAFGQRPLGAALNIDQRQPGPHHALRRADAANRRKRPAIGRYAHGFVVDVISHAKSSLPVRRNVDEQYGRIEDAIGPGGLSNHGKPGAVVGKIVHWVDREFALCLGCQVDSIPAFTVKSDKVRVRQVCIFMKPVIPVPHRLLGKSTGVRALLRLLRRELPLLVVRNARDDAGIKYEPARLLREQEAVDSKRLVRQLLRFAALGR